LRCPWRKIWEEKTVLFESVELTCVALGTYQIFAPYIKRRERQRETQLSVMGAGELKKKGGMLCGLWNNRDVNPLQASNPSNTAYYVTSYTMLLFLS
jgi:hypothetical protein